MAQTHCTRTRGCWGTGSRQKYDSPSAGNREHVQDNHLSQQHGSSLGRVLGQDEELPVCPEDVPQGHRDSQVGGRLYHSSTGARGHVKPPLSEEPELYQKMTPQSPSCPSTFSFLSRCFSQPRPSQHTVFPALLCRALGSPQLSPWLRK